MLRVMVIDMGPNTVKSRTWASAVKRSGFETDKTLEGNLASNEFQLLVAKIPPKKGAS